MLPKVAGQILHHTSRAVAVVQGQAGHAVRNALQTGQTNLGQWNGPGSSSSGWNGSGPSSGGAKFHSSSSRFQANYAVSIFPFDAGLMSKIISRRAQDEVLRRLTRHHPSPTPWTRPTKESSWCPRKIVLSPSIPVKGSGVQASLLLCKPRRRWSLGAF